MIPISLTLKGIYSYQTKEQVIDFNHLSSAGLFGIFGSVGSGKSTILEAISYALYGETERLNRRENRGYNMMNLKSDQLLIDFIFKNGADNQEYRFIVKGRRNTKRFDDVKTFERQAFKKVKNDWLPISADAAEEITGLNYVNFRRTIIIPQGRFQEFLQLGDTDRTRMMKELFQLDRFDLYDKTRGLEYKNQNQIINVEGQLQQLDEVSEERIVEITKQITDLKNLMLENQQKLKEKEAKVAEMKSLAQLFEKIRLLEIELGQLSQQKSEIEQLKLQLKEYQNCLLQFKNKIEKLADDKKKYEVLTHEISAAQKQFEQLQQELEKLELTFNILKDQYAEKEVLKTEASAYSKILNIKQLKNEIQLLQGREQNGKRTLENTVGIIEKLEKERDEVRSEIQQLKNNQPDISELARIKTWYVELNNLIKELKNAELQIEGNLEKKVQHHTEIVKLAKKNGLELKEIDNAFIHSHFANGIEALEQEKEAFELELKHLNVKHGLIQYAENLIEGEACPVCGSIHHPDKMETADLSEKIKNYENKLKSTKENIKTFSEADKTIGKKLIEYQVVEYQLNEAIEKSKELKSNIEKHNNSYQFEQKLKEEEVEKTFAWAEKSQSELKNKEVLLAKVEIQLADERINKEKYLAAIHQIGNDLASKQANCEMLLAQTDLEHIEDAMELADNVIKTKIESLNATYQKLVKDYELLEKNIQNLKPQKDKLQGIIESKTIDNQQLKKEIHTQQQILDNELFASNYQSLDEIKIILAKAFDIDKENQKISSFENRLFSTEEQLKSLRKSTENKVFNKDEFEQIQHELEDLKRSLDDQNKLLGSLEKDKLEQEKKLATKKKLQEEFNQLSLRAENIKILKNLFKGSGFVNYVSSVYLQNLVNAANIRFSALTSQKLRLELTDTNDFIIRDYLNEGKTRSVKTLSGGQTFQASLSLALALADNIQSVTKSENNFFFLDEGFGSLDKESLAVVFQSLKSLRKENRVVGIISHVEELQQEIDSYLKIENDAEFGSKIYRSWE